MFSDDKHILANLGKLVLGGFAVVVFLVLVSMLVG